VKLGGIANGFVQVGFWTISQLPTNNPLVCMAASADWGSPPSSPSLAPRSRDGNVGDSGKVTGLGWTTSATKPTIAASKGGDNENVTQSRCNPRR